MSVCHESRLLYDVLNASIINWQQSVHALVDCEVWGGGGWYNVTFQAGPN